MLKIHVIDLDTMTDGLSRVLSSILSDAGVDENFCSYEDANVVVLMGETACRDVGRMWGMDKWRGSVVEVDGKKTVPVYHPRYIVTNWAMRAVTVMDWKRIKLEAESPKISRMHRELCVGLSYEELVERLDALVKADKVSFDIETSHGQIECIAFSANGKSGLCVPFWYGWEGSYWTEDQEVTLWEKVSNILEGTPEKIAQNGVYDRWYLDDMGIRVNNLKWDTMLMGGIMYPEFPRDLAFLTSVYTDQPYYKYLGKVDDGIEHQKYNALDSVVTWEIANKLIQEMREADVLEFYTSHISKLIDPLYEMSRRGVRIDVTRMKDMKRVYSRAIKKLEELINKHVGHEVNVNSPKQVKELLYKELGYKEQKKRAKGGSRVTSDEDAIKACQTIKPNIVLDLILATREKRKIVSTYLEMRVSKDGRVRSSFNISGTETGRLSSSETPVGEGGNLQNIPSDIRKLFLPDEGKVFVAADQSQAEARVVAYVANDDRMIDFLEDKTKDIHKYVASLAFGVPVESVTKEQRNIAKKIGHGSNYARSALGIAKKDGISLERAKKCQDAYFKAFPGIKRYHFEIVEQLKKTRTLTTPFGRKRVFYGAFDNNMFREAYAYIPQSTVGDLSNYALRGISERIRVESLDVQIVLQVHDELVCQCRPEDVKKVTTIMCEELQLPIQIGKRIMVIPAEVHTGKTWKECK